MDTSSLSAETIMPLSLKEYLLNSSDSAELYYLNAIADQEGEPPFMAVLNDVAVIGPLMVHLRRDGHLFAIDAEKAEARADLKHAAGGEAAVEFRNACEVRRTGPHLMLWNMRALNYWHWTMEVLTKVVMAQATNFRGYYVVPPPNGKQRFIGESLTLMGIHPRRIIPYDGRPWLIEQLYVPQPINGYSSLMRYPAIMARLRGQLLDACLPSPYKTNRIFIARDQNVSTRRVSNETELLATLFKYDFQRVAIDLYPLKEQIRMAAVADCLVGPHGAGMTHCLFMKPGGLVMELFNPNYVNPCMLPVIDHLKHRYYMIPSAGINVAPSDNIAAYIEAIILTLNRELGRPNICG
jgi:capsular polysaccharide biosynthesis protein